MGPGASAESMLRSDEPVNDGCVTNLSGLIDGDDGIARCDDCC